MSKTVFFITLSFYYIWYFFFNLKVSEEDKMAKKSIPEKPQKYAINRLLLSDTTKDSDEDTSYHRTNLVSETDFLRWKKC